MKFLPFLLITLLSLPVTQAQDLSGIRVDTHGQSVRVWEKGKKLKRSATVKNIQVGDIIQTDQKSMARLTLPSNGKVFLSPLTKVYVRSKTQQGRFVLSLLEGDLYFETKKGSPWTKRPPGALIHVRNYPSAYYGQGYRLKFNPLSEEKGFVEVQKEPVKMVKLSKKSTKPSKR